MKSLSQNLSKWYLENRRDLPWRSNRNPYHIWISEVMLQQTTVQAVIPFYQRFLTRFPSVQSLADAPLEDVYEVWAGLGYYSRARNLHKAAKALAEKGFPKTAAELLELPGFGPYTSRAVASLAFGENVGVLDGNVIRVLSRAFALPIHWWTTKGRKQLQDLSDELANEGDSAVINQGLMELGATVCTPQNPTCFMCPWKAQCVGLEKDIPTKFPVKKPRRPAEVWVWKPLLIKKANKYAVIQNDYTPFLKGQWIFPGTIKKQDEKPKIFDLQHAITHHSIFIKVIDKKPADTSLRGIKWVSASELKKLNPSSLLQKVIEVEK